MVDRVNILACLGVRVDAKAKAVAAMSQSCGLPVVTDGDIAATAFALASTRTPKHARMFTLSTTHGEPLVHSHVTSSDEMSKDRDSGSASAKGSHSKKRRGRASRRDSTHQLEVADLFDGMAYFPGTSVDGSLNFTAAPSMAVAAANSHRGGEDILLGLASAVDDCGEGFSWGPPSTVFDFSSVSSNGFVGAPSQQGSQWEPGLENG